MSDGAYAGNADIARRRGATNAKTVNLSFVSYYGEAHTIRGRLVPKISPVKVAHRDGAGGWITPLGAERLVDGGT